MSELALAIQRDLAAASEHLLDEGFAERRVAGAPVLGVRGPLGHTLRLVAALLGSVPRALLELERLPASRRESVIAVRVPRRAAPSRRPYDYIKHEGRLAPVVWETRQPEFELPIDALAWLAHGVDLASDRLAWHRSILERSRDEAVRFREGTSFGRDELSQLDARQLAIDEAGLALIALRRRLDRLAPARLRPSPRLPFPFPHSPAWRSTRATIRALEEPSSALASLLSDLVDPDDIGLDLGYLYQRWCGLKLVVALGELGFWPTTDPVPPLLLAGSVEFRRDGCSLMLLIEPRLASRKRAIHGLFVRRGESSPDLVLVGDSEAGPVVYVLDPTLRRTPEARAEKKKYLDVLSVRRSRTVAGVRVASTGPDRAWAAAPIDGSSCLLDDWRGDHGTIPMDPLSFESAPLAAWLTDVTRAVLGEA
ncbi:MAG: hypothetical protein WD226_02645 [Planctomycetota bacterium]